MDNEKDPTPPAESATGVPPAADEGAGGGSVRDLLDAARGEVKGRDEKKPDATARESARAEAPAPGAPDKPAPAPKPPAKPAPKQPPAKPAAAGAATDEGASERETPSATPPAAKVAPGAAKTTSTPTPSVAKGVPKAAAKPAGTVVQAPPPEPPVNKLRRRIVWVSVASFLATSFLMFLRFFLPRAIFEPSNVFRVGFPTDYGVGVDTKWQQQYRIWVVKNTERLFVITAICTHLGCTPDWKSSENKFKCPCHGSGYDSEGINFEGPAPRPMDRAHIELDAEGQIVVNKDRLYKWEKGKPSEFDRDGAYIRA